MYANFVSRSGAGINTFDEWCREFSGLNKSHIKSISNNNLAAMESESAIQNVYPSNTRIWQLYWYFLFYRLVHDKPCVPGHNQGLCGVISTTTAAAAIVVEI